MEKFTAAQARELMPDRFNEMVEQIHTDIREAALAGKTGITITFRSEFNMNCWEDNITKRYSNYSRSRKDPVGVRQFEAQCIYRPKGQVEHEEAFSHLNTIIPTGQNAFLFNKRWKG